MMILKSQELSRALRAQIKERAALFRQSKGRSPSLAVILVGQDPASQVYVRNKVAACEEVGFKSAHHELPENTDKAELRSLIEGLNADPTVDGILVQLPLPKHLSSDEVISWISPSKDPDALTVENQGLLFVGRPRVAPCTPSGVIELLKHYKISMAGKNAVVIGRSQIVGKPMAQLLLMENATVTIAHSKTADLQAVTSQADILVVAAGRPKMIQSQHVKKGAVVIDVGIHRTATGLCGDVDLESLAGHALAVSPVPGGVGPMTITMLLMNTLKLAESSFPRG
jgi:methylenetetrahydrofolate dehydrogenase (NADP+) / methenyltetrahydrofolate cyclohydrolase